RPAGGRVPGPAGRELQRRVRAGAGEAGTGAARDRPLPRRRAPAGAAGARLDDRRPRRDAPPARHGRRRDPDRPDRGAAGGAGRAWPVGQAVIATGRRPLDLDGPEAARLYRALVLPRLIEERMLTLLRQGKLSKWF